MSITKIITPELLDFPNDSTSSANTSGTVIPAGNNYVSGGGGLVENSLTLAVSTTYTVTVGTGGSGASGTTPGDGLDSTISGSGITTITATGGGSGAFTNNISNSGGSGAGGQGGDTGTKPGAPGNGTQGQGYRGGTGWPRGYQGSNNEAAGGGGGAGGVGGNATNGTGGAGGIGIISYIKNAAGDKYAGGGSGGGRSVGGLAVSGYGGGDGSATANTGGDGTDGQGGGGGSSGGNAAGTGGDGGNGIIIIRYPVGITVNTFTGGGTTDNAIGGSTDLYSEITSSGTIEFTGTPSSFTADYLVLAGGGAGGQDERGGAGAGGLRTSYGITRPASADAGEFRYNEQYGYVEYYDGSNWQQIADEYITGQPTSCICSYPTSAVALYEFQDNTNNTCGGSAGTLYGTPTYVTGNFGKAIDFNGTNQGITLPSILPPNSSSSSSATVWFKTSDTSGAQQTLIESWDGTTGSNGGWAVWKDLGNVLRLGNYYLSGSSVGTDGTTSVADGNWHFIAVVFDYSGGTLSLYLDGNSTPEVQFTGLTPGTVNIFSGSGALGYQIQGGPFRYFPGSMDQFRVFPIALSQTQITELYNEIPCN